MGTFRLLLTIAVFISQVTGQLPSFPVFTTLPEDTESTVGAQVNLTCGASYDSETVSYSWSFAGAPLNGSASRTLLFPLSAERVGQYSCLATVSAGTLASTSTYVQIASLERGSLPQDKQETVDETFSLGCDSYISTGPVTVSWQRRIDTFIVSSGFGTTGIRDNRLYFTGTVETGLYACVVRNTASGATVEGTYNVIGATTSEQPLILSRPENAVVPVGGTAAFQCIPSGSAAVTWRGPGGSTISSPFPGGLVVSRVEASNAGEYACIVGGQAYSAQLTVVGPPVVSSSSSPNISTPYGGSLSLRCASTQQGAPRWAWFKDGRAVLPDARVRVEGPILSLSSLTLDDGGYYQCRSRDELGQYGSAAILASVQLIPPSFVNADELQDMVVFAGDNVELKCTVHSAPSSTFAWFRGAGSLLSQSSKYNTDLPGKLVISNVTAGDQGMYRCEVTCRVPENNALVGTASHQREIKVIQPTFFTKSPPPYIYRQLKPSPEDIDLECVAEGDALANISYSWLKDGMPFSPPNGPSSNTVGTLTLSNWQTSDSGVYTCVVSTASGNFTSAAPKTIEASSNVTFAVLPAQPSSVGGSTQSSTSVSLQWTYDGDSKFINSVIVRKEVQGSNTLEFVRMLSIDSVEPFTVDDLFPFTNYSFRIEVVDKNQQTAYSSSGYIATFEAVPTAHPIITGSTIVNSTHLKVTWQPPPLRTSARLGRNGVVTAYEIRYNPPEGDFATYSLSVVPGSQHEIYLPGSAFKVSIAAQNVNGTGAFSPVTLLNGSDLVEGDPFYQEVWFIVVVCVVGVLLGAILVVVLAICCVCCRRARKNTFQVNNFLGGDQPHFDVYQYEMEKTTRLRSIRAPQEGYDVYQPEFDSNNIGNGGSVALIMQDGGGGYLEGGASMPPPVYGPPPSIFPDSPLMMTRELEQQPVHLSPHMYARNRALSYEWDPRQQQQQHQPGGFPDHPHHLQHLQQQQHPMMGSGRVLQSRSMEWSNGGFGYPAEVMVPEHRREVISIHVGGEDGSEDSMRKPPVYEMGTDDSFEEDGDHHSVSQAPTDCSTFV